jgi:hypothetical protein
MFAPLTRMLTALSALAENVLQLAGTVAEVNVALRERLQLAGPDQTQVIDHEPAETNGTRRGKRQPA